MPRAFGLIVLMVPLTIFVGFLPVEGQSTADRARVLNDEGVRLFDAGDYEKARGRFEEALRLDSGAERIRANLGRTHAAIGCRAATR